MKLWNRTASFHVIIIKILLRRGKHDYVYTESVDSANRRIIIDHATFYQILQVNSIIVEEQLEYRKAGSGLQSYNNLERRL